MPEPVSTTRYGTTVWKEHFLSEFGDHDEAVKS
jgi:hypothetical protein